MPETYEFTKAYPRQKRKSVNRVVTEEGKKLAAKLDFDYYDGDRKNGFGSYNYDGRWKVIAKVAIEKYNLNKDSKVLIDRSDKGFLVFDLMEEVPGITIYGTHRSEYSINHSMDGYGKWLRINNPGEERNHKLIEQEAREKVSPFLIKADLFDIPFKDNYFDSVISINNVCAYENPLHIDCVKEIKRVTKDNGANSYIQNDAWRNDEEKQNLMNWTYLCKIFKSDRGWGDFFSNLGYQGDWGYTIIE